jgi:flagellar motor switch protein FliG
MSLLEEATRLQASPGTPCRIRTMKDVNPALHAEIMEAIRSGIQMSAISRALAGRGVTISADTLSRHQRGDCLRCR